MNRTEKEFAYHKQGYNCCQSVVAAFSDKVNMSEEALMNIGSGFGAGAGTGEMCGAITGAIMALNLMTPVDMEDPVGSKKRAVAQSKEFQKRFKERFGYLRCQDLLANKTTANEMTAAANALGLTKHCDIMVVTAAEIVEEMLAEQE